MDEIINCGDLKDTEKFKALEKSAFENTIDISDFAPAEYKYFDKLREISAEYRAGRLTREELNSRRKIFYRQYEAEVDERLNYLMALKEQQDNIARSEQLRSEINKADNARDAAEMALKCISAMICDSEMFYKSNKDKLKGLEK